MIRKVAVLVTGEKDAGKSKMINEYLKPKLGIEKDVAEFDFNVRKGVIMPFPLQHTESDLDSLDMYEGYDIFVIAVRPETEKQKPSNQDVKNKLVDLGYRVLVMRLDAAGENEDENAVLDAAAGFVMSELNDHCGE